MKTEIKQKINKILSELSETEIAELKEQFLKFNYTDKSTFDFKTGYSYLEEKFSAGFNIRATYVVPEQLNKIDLPLLFDMLFEKINNSRSQKYESMIDTLDNILNYGKRFKLIVYPSMYLKDAEESVAIRFKINCYE